MVALYKSTSQNNLAYLSSTRLNSSETARYEPLTRYHILKKANFYTYRMLFGNVLLTMAGAFALVNGAVVAIYKDQHCQHYVATHNVEYNGECVHAQGFQSMKILKDGNHATDQFIRAWSSGKCGHGANAVARATDMHECVRAINPAKTINIGSNSLSSGRH